ncbi:hypothetical protein [Rossellomorea sp. BNER]|uniref:hypothetical protein n=1 Tax=Rossellomorea sp. BNER TaxID=2962031 RepID=UPI003AF27DF3|nr:hypothetical protein [Rossellomorea sp. BNER]
MNKVKKFKLEYITISFLVMVGIVLILGIYSGLSSFKEFISFSFIILLLLFLTLDIKKVHLRKSLQCHRTNMSG